MISYFPADDRILYSADQGGNEMHKIYVLETDGTVRNLTPDEGMFMVLFHGWSGDRESFFVESNKRDMRHFDLYKISAQDYSEELIYQNDDLYQLGPVSPDGKTLVLEKETDNRSRTLSLHDLDAGETRQITLSDVHISNHGEAFSPDGSSLYYTTDKWHEFRYLARYDMDSLAGWLTSRPVRSMSSKGPRGKPACSRRIRSTVAKSATFSLARWAASRV